MVNQGCKQTQIGEIPEDWEVKLFREISFMKGRIGWQGLKQTEFTMNGEEPFLITGMNFKDGEIRWDEVYHISEKRYEIAKEIQLKVSDVLMTKDGTIGKILFITKIPHPGKATLNSHLLVFRPLYNSYFPKFLYYQLLSKTFRDFIELNKYGTTFFGISQKAVGEYKVFLPSIPEQKAIAEVLSDADNLLEKLDRLITKKKRIKQGAMQQLLTGKKRLSGFKGEWKDKKLGDIGEIIKGQGLSKSKISDYGAYSCILYGELFTKYKEEIKEVLSKTSFNEGRQSKYGDVLIPGSTTTTGIDLAKASALLVKDVLLGGDINIIRNSYNSYDPLFLAYCLTHIYKNRIAQKAKGITIHHLHGKDLTDLEIRMPDTKEQQAIAQILSDMGAEIGSLERKRDKYKLLKEGMMQQLLTGKIRLPWKN